MLLENLNAFAYKNTLFYEKNGDVYVKFNLPSQRKTKSDIHIEGIKVADAGDFKAIIDDLKAGNYEIVPQTDFLKTDNIIGKNGRREINEIKKENVSGSVRFMESCLVRYIEQDEKRKEEIHKQPFAESFLKVLPPLVTCDENGKEVEFNFQNMKDKESIGRFINKLNIKSGNKLVKSNIGALNDFIYEIIREKALKSKEGHFEAPNFNSSDITGILNKKSFKKTFMQKEDKVKLEQTAGKLSINLNVYFRSALKSRPKDLERFRKYIADNGGQNLYQLEKFAQERKPERDRIKGFQATLSSNFKQSAVVLAEKVFCYAVFNMFKYDKEQKENPTKDESKNISINNRPKMELVESYREIG